MVYYGIEVYSCVKQTIFHSLAKMSLQKHGVRDKTKSVELSYMKRCIQLTPNKKVRNEKVRRIIGITSSIAEITKIVNQLSQSTLQKLKYSRFYNISFLPYSKSMWEISAALTVVLSHECFQYRSMLVGNFIMQPFQLCSEQNYTFS